MNRLFLLRRCSMSSIEEEDESIASDEVVIPRETVTVTVPIAMEAQLCPSTSDWDSELSESEHDFDGQHESVSMNQEEEQAANRALKSFQHSHPRWHQVSNNALNGSSSPYSIHLHEQDKSSDLDLIISELQDFQSEFDHSTRPSCSNLRTKSSMTSHTASTIKSSSTSGCVYELRTLEDQLEAALASLTLSISDSSPNSAPSNSDQIQNSSDSSACSSGVGEDLVNESFSLYPLSNLTYQTDLIKSRSANGGGGGDDGDSAFSDTESTDKLLSTNPNEGLLYRSMAPLTPQRPDSDPLVMDPIDAMIAPSPHPHPHPSRILVRTYNDDGSTKSIFIDDSMAIRDVLFLLIHKNHREPHMDYVLLEVLPDLHMERIFEDHQKLSEAILMWPTVSTNRLNFTRRSEKYTLFRSIAAHHEQRHSLDIEGTIYFKEKSRKSWKKYFCVLRSSGLYFVPKGKSKKEMMCLAKLENVELFFGIDWKKKFKAPTDYCFALKHPLIQKKSSKYIKYMCVETKEEFDRWIINIRIAKFGQQLKMNYLLMERAMNIYRSSGRFAVLYQSRVESPFDQCQSHELPISHDRPLVKPNTQYYEMHPIAPAHDDYQNSPETEPNEDRSPIKSASYMDELRQRLERVLNDQPVLNSAPYSPIPPLIPTPKSNLRRPILTASPKLKPAAPPSNHSPDPTGAVKTQIRPGVTLGSTPLPRKQLATVGSQSYRTINASNHSPYLCPSPQMSKSFIIPSKRDQKNTSSSSTPSNAESVSFEESNLSLSKSVVFDNGKNGTKGKPIAINRVESNRLKAPVPLKKGVVSPDPPIMKSRMVSASPAPTRSSNRLIPSPISAAAFSNGKITPIANGKSLPMIPPRKSSIAPAAAKSPIPSRDHPRRAHISHL